MTIKQLNIQLENQPGRLRKVSEAMASAGVDIYAMTVSEHAGAGVFRLLVSDIDVARNVIMDTQMSASVDEVIAFRIPDDRGSLARLLQPISEQAINIVYMYAFTCGAGHAVAVFRFGEPERAIGALREHGFEPTDLAGLFDASGADR